MHDPVLRGGTAERVGVEPLGVALNTAERGAKLGSMTCVLSTADTK